MSLRKWLWTITIIAVFAALLSAFRSRIALPISRTNEAQRIINQKISDNQWQGTLTFDFWMKSITVNIPNANYLDIKLLMAAIMKELPWLTHINWIHPELSEDEQKDLSSQFPETIISISGAQE